jgi:hypothetical protein
MDPHLNSGPRMHGDGDGADDDQEVRTTRSGNETLLLLSAESGTKRKRMKTLDCNIQCKVSRNQSPVG